MLFVIHARDIPDAFITWKRMTGRFRAFQEDFENELVEFPENLKDCLVLTSDGLTREETLQIINTKSYTKGTRKVVIFNENIVPKPEEIKTVRIIESVTSEQLEELTELGIVQVKRGRGRPRKNPVIPEQKNNISDGTSMENYFQ